MSTSGPGGIGPKHKSHGVPDAAPLSKPLQSQKRRIPSLFATGRREVEHRNAYTRAVRTGLSPELVSTKPSATNRVVKFLKTTGSKLISTLGSILAKVKR